MVTNKVRTYALGFQNVIVPLISLGHEVIWAADFSDFMEDRNIIPCRTFQIDIYSYPFHKTNIRAYRQLKQIINEEKVEAIQCSTPIGGLLARVAALRCGVKNVIYTAHGFLFFNGAPLINRTLYKLQEFLLARATDVLITINEEDYHAAKKIRLRKGKIPYMIHGAGIKIGGKISIDVKEKRKTLGFKDSDVIVVSAGDLNPNKNNKVVIQAFSKITDRNIHYVICGIGILEEKLKKIVKTLCLEENVHFLGYRTDMLEILACADMLVMPSFREGVPRAILEAMDIGLPCIGSKTRGIADLIVEGKGGYLCDPNDPDGFADAIKRLASEAELRKIFGTFNRERAKGYSDEVVRNELVNIYRRELR